MLQVKVYYTEEIDVAAHSLSFDGITQLIKGQYNCQILGCKIIPNVKEVLT